MRSIKKIALVFIFTLCVLALIGCTNDDKNKVTKVALNKAELTLTVGEKETVVATLTPSGATDKVTWKSSDEAVAKVKDGEIEAVSKGSATISASVGSLKAEVEVTVVNEKFTVTFVTNGGSTVASVEIESGAVLNVTNPTKANNEFVGWYKETQLVTLFNMSTPVTSDLTLYAKWSLTKATVTFDTDGGSEIANIDLVPGEKVSKPTNPTKEKHNFGGWYTDETFTTPYNFNLPVEENITLYAKWNPVKYLVSFDVNGGDTPLADATVIHNEKLVAPTNPLRAGYSFIGWFTDEELTTAYDFNTPVTAVFTLYAKWEAGEASYTVKHLTYNSTTKEFDLAEEKVFTSTTDAEVVVYPNEYPGLMSEKLVYKAIVLADSSLVIEIKYIEPVVTFDLVLNGGNLTYETREEMVADFLADYNTFSNTSFTLETLPTGSWSPVNFHTMFYDTNYRDKWLWMPVYLGQVGSNANKSGNANVAAKATLADFEKVSDDKYRVSYEVRGFILGIKFKSNANFISSDYSDYTLANDFWNVFAEYNEQTSFENLPEPYTLPTEVYKEGFTFGGWYTNPELTGEAITVANRMYTLYAKWNEKNPVTEVVITNKVATMEKLSTHQLIVNVLPEDAFNKSVYFLTSNEKVAKVDENGLISALNAGTVTITVMSVNGVVSDTFELTVYPTDNLDVTFSENYNGTLEVGKEADIIAVGGGTFEDVELVYTSTNTAVLTVDANGKFKAIAKGNADIEIKVKDSDDVIITITVAVIEPSTATRADQLLNLLTAGNNSVVDALNVSLLYDDNSAFQQYYASTYGSVNAFLFDDLNLDSTNHLVDPNSIKSSGLKTSTEFIIVHDTANLSGGLLGHASYWKTMTHSTSIHFTVGDYGVVQSLDTKYSAHHAGDGTSTTFKWIETGVSATGNVKPVIDISTDGYFTVNGTKTTVLAPTGKNGEILDKSYFGDLGPTWNVIDGKYYLGTHFFTTSQDTRGKIGSYGGNLNSTGIEMCVNKDGDIYDTWQRTAKLVGQLMIEHGLDINKVIQHNTITGKNCPQSLREAQYWNTFIKMVALENEIKANYSDAEISMVSDNPTLLSNTGRIIGRPNTTTSVTYSITVKIGEEVRTIKLGSVIPGISGWDQLDGFYSIKK